MARTAADASAEANFSSFIVPLQPTGGFAFLYPERYRKEMQSTCRSARASAGAALALAFAASLLATLPAPAQEAACSSFEWPLTRELQLLSAHDLATIETGAAIKAGGPAAVVKLRPMVEAAFLQPPERQPKRADSFGGVVSVGSFPAAGLYQITLSGEAWIDVIQDGQRLKSVAFSGRQGCAGMRKSVRFQLNAAPATIQISGAADARIALVVTPAQ
ncbi:MAG: hypothetical protein QM651_03100 [Rhodoblastus sp.]